MNECDVEQTHIDAPQTDNASQSVSYGKFDSAEALYEAYTNLEKEFTKKCQLIKNVENPLSRQEIVEKLVEINPVLGKVAEELSGYIDGGERAEYALAKVMTWDKLGGSIVEDEEFMNRHVYNNEDVRGKIIADYMDSLSQLKPPKSIKNGGQTVITPVSRPKDLKAAGILAKELLNSRRI